jgi:hypothetical protein
LGGSGCTIAEAMPGFLPQPHKGKASKPTGIIIADRPVNAGRINRRQILLVFVFILQISELVIESA